MQLHIANFGTPTQKPSKLNHMSITGMIRFTALALLLHYLPAHASYHTADRLTQINEPNRSISYTLDGVANRLTETITDNNQTTINDKTYSYNNRDQLQTVTDAISNSLTEYQYDNNSLPRTRSGGNQISKTDASGTTNLVYGPRDRLLTITLPGAPPIAYSYNEAGLRDSQSQNGQTLHYIYDQQSLIAETNSINDEIARYTHSSVGLIAEARSGVQTYLHTDALSTPFAITDTTGAVTTRYTWDTWGKLQQQTGSSQQPFGFTGYQRDEQTGLHYAQQRYYDAEIGRFNRHDPFRGEIDTPLSLHRYLYANANPTIFVDPTGEFPYLQNKADELAALRKRQLDNAANFQSLADSGIGGRSIGVLASLGSGLLGAGAGLLEGGTRSVNFVANFTTRAVISDNSNLAGQLDSELDDSFAAIDQVLTGAGSAARLVVEDPAEAGSVAVEFAVSNAQKLGNQLDRAFIQGDTRAFAEVTEFTGGGGAAGVATRVAVVAGRQGLRQSLRQAGETVPITDPARLLPAPDGRQAELQGGPIFGVELPKGFRFNQAVGPGQKTPGKFGTLAEISSVDFVRNKLAVIPDFKEVISGARVVEVKRPARAQISIVGPQKVGEKTFEGGEIQIEVLEFDRNEPFVGFIGKEKVLK